MTNLGLAGASSLQALNQWISVIDTNLTNSTRIGYKETRLSLRTNEVETVGKTFTHFGDAIQIPSASLMLDKTLILAYEQGMLRETENNTDFAIEGTGYFVVEDDAGMRYATRDGQFHFNDDGILINDFGLKVLTTGQDYIRVAPSEVFSVNSVGSSLNSSLYGDRQLMMIDLPNAGALFYSKYGFTTFELGNFVPIQVNNSFDKGMNGLNPYLSAPVHSVRDSAAAGETGITLDSVTGLDVGSQITINGQVYTIDSPPGGILGTFVTFQPPLARSAPAGTLVKTNYQNLYTHTKETTTGSGFVTVDISANSQALVTAHKFIDFSNSFRFTSNADLETIASYGINFGQKTPTDTLSESGFFAGIEQGFLVIRNADGALATSVALPNLPAGVEYDLSLSMSRGTAILTLSEALTGKKIDSIRAEGISGLDYRDTYQSIGTNDIAGPSLPGTEINLNSMHVEERDKIPYYDLVMLGGSAEKLDSQIRQQYVEESTSTVADAMPLLSNTQKMFASLSKIISVSNTVLDDLNGLIR